MSGIFRSFLNPFGGGDRTSSSSATSSTSQQNYTDNRSVTNNDSHAAWNSNNSTDSHNLAFSDSHDYTSSVTDSGNSWSNRQSFDTGHNTTTSDSGNSFAQWLSSLTNSGNTSDSRSYTSSSNDARSYSSTDSHAVSDSGNSSTTINWSGTDPGLERIAQLQANLTQAIGEQGYDAMNVVGRYGSQIGGAATDLAALSIQNSMTASSHMMDLTGELIDRIATGASSAVAGQVQIADDGASQARASVQAGSHTVLLIAAAVVVVALILKK